MNNAINKYGWTSVQSKIVFQTTDENVALEKEKEFIILYKTQNRHYGYNITSGGDASSGGWRMHELARQHVEESMQEFGKPVVCYETGQVFRSMAEAARWCGAKPPDLRNAVRHFPFYSVMGYHWFEEGIDVSGITIKPPRIWSSKSVMCVETKEKFDSMKEAADRYNTTVFFIRRACQQEGQVAAGYHWRFDNVQDTK